VRAQDASQAIDENVPGIRTESSAANTSAPSVNSAAAASSAGSANALAIQPALEKRVRDLESEIIKLWNYANTIRRSIPGDDQIANIIDTRAALLINRYLGGKGDDATRLPMPGSEGGVTLSHIIVGEDRAEETVSTNGGLRVACVVRGPKAQAVGKIFLAVYALPETDLVLRPEWIIHADDAVPYIDGSGQTHFIWRGDFSDGSKAAKGKYLVFARAIVNESGEKILGSAMRYWGGRAADGSNANMVMIR
jgi:hypothetical protein